MLKRKFTADKPNQKWMTDIKQYRLGDQRLKLSAIKDLCGKDIVAFHMSREMILNWY
ncbi:hypothetical protein [Paenibacillus prosopidis]|uniref:Transposase n=1 Tax=Paenibacillus prosopidis TaxID=630520 RepID=A0A368VLU0_9BACL|nr:hypothetical protein [Paenibacillus prosopidis]RCW40624.1 hypothetical protein DFP97_1303 [Paenibacillus prosopidis]